MKPFIIVLFMAALLGCSNQEKIDYQQIESYQDHSVPTLEMDLTDTSRVLLIFPHADDEIVVGGLIMFLKEQGASIHLLTLCGHNEARGQELNCSAARLGIEKVDVAGLVNNTWDDIMEDKILFWYDQEDSIKRIIQNKINDFKPDVLVTYDTEIGGYGHPEHRISAQLTEDLFLENKDNPEFRPKHLLQLTLSDKLESFFVAKSPGYEWAKKLTGSDGLPDPDFALDIRPYWEAKNEAGLCYQSQIKILRKFSLVYDEENKQSHINAFSKEYYTLLKR
ncbi:MAG: PIG-L family deacetylase [Bacteroidales bacterium]|nr:PIG-L family deacetylase [Bacteroidales bacterium]